MLSGLSRIAFVSLAVGSLLITASAIHAAEPVDMLADAVWHYSMDDGQTWQNHPPTIPAETVATVIFRADFNGSAVPDNAVSLALTHSLTPHKDTPLTFAINGRPVYHPYPDMFYRTYPDIPPGVITPGVNQLTGRTTYNNVTSRYYTAKEFTFDPNISLTAVMPRDVRIISGPMLGPAGEDFFTITLSTTAPASITLATVPLQKTQTAPRIQTSPIGLVHRFMVDSLPSAQRFINTLTVAPAGNEDAAAEPVTVSSFTYPQPEDLDDFRFIMLADNRSVPRDWAKVAAAAAAENPLFTLHGGDLVGRGLCDWEWEPMFFTPGAPLFAAPMYVVPGNHEEDAPLYWDLFLTPEGLDARSRAWTQVIGSVRIIGIEGLDDWSDTSENIRWLENVLQHADEKFVLLYSHYPAWTSAGHGRLGDDGRPRERSVRHAKEVIMPMLEKYNATAMLAGHDHTYERSEPPAGVTHIVSGGAGVSRHQKTDTAEMQNPHSQVFSAELHFCLLEVNGDTLTLTAITPDGEQIDQRTWTARNLARPEISAETLIDAEPAAR